MTPPAPDSRQLRPSASTYAGLFMVTLSTLMYEIALTRVFSVTMWYHFAFVAISVALFGLTIGALLVHVLPERFRDVDVARHLWVFALAFAVSIALCVAIQLSIPVEPKLTMKGAVTVVATCLVVSVPFVFSGIVVCLALTRFPARVNRLYATDLVGAGLGCILLVVLFERLDGPSLVIAIGALAGVGALVFAVGARTRLGMASAVTAVAILGGFALLNGHLHNQGDAVLRVRWAKEQSDPRHLYEKWNAFSRITVDGDPNLPQKPSGHGMSLVLPESTMVNQLSMVIDSTAGTLLTRYTGDSAETDFLRYDLTNLAHNIRTDADVLVVGVGGGRDVLSALEFEQRSVTGVEINGNIIDAVNGRFGDFTGHLDQNPKVRFVEDEARSYVARTEREYDIIQISLIDTWAATSAGAYALTENSLYTTEAWDLFLDRLKPGGVLSVSRWYELLGRDPLETYRTASLAAEALTERGVENPRDHILIYHGPPQFAALNAATVLVSPDPFSRADIDTLAAEVDRLEFTPVLTPNTAIDPQFAAITARGGPDDAVERFDEDISAPSDDRPFFFQMADLDTFLSGRGFDDDFVFRPVLVLAILGITVVALAAACIALPLVVDKRRRRSAPRGMAPFYTYFAGIGFGFLLIEVSQLHRLSIFLGHPTYALSVVLFSVLLFSGIGSMLTERFVQANRPASLVAPLFVLLVVVASFGFVTRAAISRADGATTPARLALAVALLAPLAVPMGMPFAIGMRAASARPGAPTAFLWGINGATSVCASVLGVVLSIFLGISVAFWAGALAYAVALSSMGMIVSRGRRQPPPEPAEPAVEPEAAPVGAPV